MRSEGRLRFLSRRFIKLRNVAREHEGLIANSRHNVSVTSANTASLLLGVAVDAHEEHRAGGALVDDVDEGEVGDEGGRLHGPRRPEAEDRGRRRRHRACPGEIVHRLEQILKAAT